jgi:predicted secreted Zn-dependent protease
MYYFSQKGQSWESKASRGHCQPESIAFELNAKMHHTIVKIPKDTYVTSMDASLILRSYRTLGVVLLFALVAAIVPAASQAAVIRNLSNPTYAISGNTASQLRQQMIDRGPGDHFAYTSWRISWSYRTYIDGSGRCRTKDVRVSQSVIKKMPTWSAPASASRDLRLKWYFFITALAKHENGHVWLSALAANDIDTWIRALNDPSCSNVHRAASFGAYGRLDKLRAQDIAYDRSTNHGLNDGAVF